MRGESRGLGSFPLALLISLPGAAGALAGENASTGLEEVIVTAQKREENLQKVPAAVTAIDAEELAKLGVDRAEDIKVLAPNVDVNRNINVVNIFVRGIGSAFLGPGADNSVAVHIDGAYIQPSRALRSGFFDVDRIEVLRGPQGSLYGRNATGGSVNVVTRGPTDTVDGYAKISGGNYDRLEAEIAAGGPLSDSFSGRISAVHREHSGYYRNIATGRDVDDLDETGGRAQLKFARGDFEALLSAEAFIARAEGFGWHSLGAGRSDTPLLGTIPPIGGITNQDIRTVAQDVQPEDRLDTYGTTLTMSYDINDDLSLRSISAFHDMRSLNRTEIDNTSARLAPLTQTEDSHWFSQELQLIQTSDRLRSIIGAYYFTESSEAIVHIDFSGMLNFVESVNPFLQFPNKVVHQEGSLDTEAMAIFANLEYAFTDRFKGTVGLRYSHEEKSTVGREDLPLPTLTSSVFSFPVNGDEQWDALSPELTLDYALTEEVLGYVRASRGFKSGTFLIGTSNALSQGGKQQIEPEYVNSYEMGLKSRLLNDRLQANLAVFHYDFEDMQINRIVGNTVFVENVPEARMFGAEAEVLMVIGDNWDANFSLGYLDATFGNAVITDPVNNNLPVNLNGNALPAAPKWTVHSAVTRTFELASAGALAVSLQGSWVDRKYFTVFEREVESQAAYAEWGARIEWTNAGRNWSLAGWGRNLSDKIVKTFGSITTADLGYPLLGAVNEPRTYGLEFEYRF